MEKVKLLSAHAPKLLRFLRKHLLLCSLAPFVLAWVGGMASLPQMVLLAILCVGILLAFAGAIQIVLFR